MFKLHPHLARRFSRRGFATRVATVFTLGGFAMALVACGGSDDGDDTAHAADNPTGPSAETIARVVAQIPTPEDIGGHVEDTYAGMVEGGAYGIGLVVQDGVAVAYLCNGVDIGHWFTGAAGEEVSLAHDAGTRLEARIEGSTATGTVTLPDGQTVSFIAQKAIGASGLYRSTELKEGHVYGWVTIVDEDGAVTGRGVGVDSKTREAVDGVSVDDVEVVPEEQPVPVDGGGDPPDSAPVVNPSKFTCDQLKLGYEVSVALGLDSGSDNYAYAYWEAAVFKDNDPTSDGFCFWAKNAPIIPPPRPVED